MLAVGSTKGEKNKLLVIEVTRYTSRSTRGVGQKRASDRNGALVVVAVSVGKG